MNCKGLYLLVALAVGSMGVVHAQDAQSDDGMMMNSATTSTSTYDSRWYFAPTIGGYYNDTDRSTNSRQFYLGVGVGRFFMPNFSLDFFYDYTHRGRDSVPVGSLPAHNGGGWSSGNFGVAARYYMGTNWRPYLLVGLMGSRHHNTSDDGWSPAAEVGVGLAKKLTDNATFRVETGYRQDFDDKSIRSEDGYGDWFAGVSILAFLGSPPAAPAPVVMHEEAPAPVDCSTLDSDNDGVNDCVDKCASTVAGTIVGPDGCAKPVVIDLRGVNFKFDRPHTGETDIAPTLQQPTADSVAILDQAVDTLTRYPAVNVELDGNTDSIGTEAYNQKLSERRAQIVYDYLTAHGIDASRIVAVKGFGEDKPIATNKTKDGRAQNRRTELVVQNPEQPAAPANP